jgi:hypothetical protein
MTPIISLNPIFTELLDAEHNPDNTVYQRYPLYTSADDKLPSHQAFKDAKMTVEASDLLAPGDENNNPEKWPHRLARPTLAVRSGNIPVYKL